MNTAKIAIINFFVSDAADLDACIDFNDVFSGTAESRRDQSSSEEMLRLVGQATTGLFAIAAMAIYFHW